MRSTRMQRIVAVAVVAVVAVVVLVAPAPAGADDGYYVREGIGGASYRGELGGYGGAPRLHIGAGVRRGPWNVEAFGAFLVPDLLFIDCYGAECAYAARPKAGLGAFGVDLHRRWRLLYLQRWAKPGVYERPGLFVTLHGGGRWFVGGDAMDGHRGPGLGGGAALEGDLWILGYYVDAGLDVFRLSGPGGAVRGSTPYLMVGVKVGWL